jgi:hypothetical protein
VNEDGIQIVAEKLVVNNRADRADKGDSMDVTVRSGLVAPLLSELSSRALSTAKILVMID